MTSREDRLAEIEERIKWRSDLIRGQDENDLTWLIAQVRELENALKYVSSDLDHVSRFARLPQAQKAAIDGHIKRARELAGMVE